MALLPKMTAFLWKAVGGGSFFSLRLPVICRIREYLELKVHNVMTGKNKNLHQQP